MKTKYFAGIAIVLLTVLVFVFWPGEADLARMRAMYERDQHEAVIVQLEEELQARPDWHEARELLVFAALKADRVDLALEHLVELERAGQYVDMMTGQLDLWLERNSPAEEIGAAALAAARAGVENSPDWLCIRKIYTDLIRTLERIEEIPRAVELVPEYVTGYFALYDDKFDYTLLWELCVLVDESDHSSHREYAVEKIWDVDKLQHLHREHPRDPVLAAGLALCQGGNEGLSFLRDWEEGNHVDEICSDYYSRVKGQLLSAADNIDQKDFNLVLPEHVLDAAVESIAEPGRCRILLSRLEEGNHFPEQRKIVEDALGTQPIFFSTEPNLRRPSLSPDGKWLGVSTSSDSIIFDVETSEAVFLRGLDPWNWYWAPNSTKVAVNGAWGNSRVYSTQGKLLHTVEIDGLEYNTRGWHGDNKLWVDEGESLSLFLYDLETGSTQPYQNGAVFPGPAGNLAWNQGSATIVEMGGKTSSLQSISVVSWLPNGSGLLLIKDDSIHLWTGQDTVDLGIPGWRSSFLGWRNCEEFYWTEFDGSSHLPRKLMGYNIRTREERDYNLPGYWAVAEGSRAVRSGYGIQVYELP